MINISSNRIENKQKLENDKQKLKRFEEYLVEKKEKQKDLAIKLSAQENNISNEIQKLKIEKEEIELLSRTKEEELTEVCILYSLCLPSSSFFFFFFLFNFYCKLGLTQRELRLNFLN
jgi:hypothetical protein